MKLRPEENREGTHGSPTSPLLFVCAWASCRRGSHRAKPGSAREPRGMEIASKPGVHVVKLGLEENRIQECTS